MSGGRVYLDPVDGSQFNASSLKLEGGVLSRAALKRISTILLMDLTVRIKSSGWHDFTVVDLGLGRMDFIGKYSEIWARDIEREYKNELQ